jgi:hypothetical protein
MWLNLERCDKERETKGERDKREIEWENMPLKKTCT